VSEALQTAASPPVEVAPIDELSTLVTWGAALFYWAEEGANEGVRDYWNTMMTGPDRVVAGFRMDLTVDELTILYGGDTGLAHRVGESVQLRTHRASRELVGVEVGIEVARVGTQGGK